MEILQKINLKNLKLDTNTEIKFNRDYGLSNITRNHIPWQYGDCMVLDDENLLFSMYYRKEGSIAEKEDGKDWYGHNSFIFHVVKNKNGIYIKYLNLHRIEDIVRTYGRKCINNVAWCQEIEFGLKHKDYKNYIRNEAMNTVKINEKEFINQILKLNDVQYDNLELFSCSISEESIDFCDYINKNYFIVMNIILKNINHVLTW